MYIYLCIINVFEYLFLLSKNKKSDIIIVSYPSFFELTYIMLQNNCLNNSVTNGLKQKKEKNMQTALYGKIKERKGEWLIGANTWNVRYLSIVTAQRKTRQRRVLIMDKARRREGTQGVQFSRLGRQTPSKPIQKHP